MAFPKIPISIVIICIIFAIIGGLWGFHVAGLLNLNPFLEHLPFIGEKFIEEDPVTEQKFSPLEEENKKLQEDLVNLKALLNELEAKEVSYQEEIKKKENEISELNKQIVTLEEKKENAQKLAQYYGQMKPKDIVPIFDNLDDETILSILISLEEGQTAKILAELDPLRAAKLTKVLTDGN